jgi:restriction endonuclease S subunit
VKTGWQVCALDDIASIESGYAFKSSDYADSGHFLVRIANVQDGYITWEKPRYVPLTDRTIRYELCPGDIVVSLTGDVGRVAAIPLDAPPCALNQRVAKISPKQSVISNRFLILYLSSMAFRLNLESKAHGAAQLNVSPKELAACQIPLPPMEEQQAIVDKLDRAFAGLETARANAEANLENAKELFQSILDKIIGNAVESPEARPLQDVTLKIGSGATPKGGKAAYKTEGIALVRSMNVHDLRFKHEGLAYIDEQQAKALQNVEIRPDDVLINITGASIARCCIVDPDILQARVNQHVAILRPDPEQIESKYLELSLVSSTNKRRLLKDGDEAGATRQALTKAGLQAFKIGIPSLSVQRQVEEEVAILKVETDRLEEEYTRQLEDLDELKQSLLQKAFAGELT